MGHVKVVVPTVNPCFECILPLFPPQKGYPICTIRTTPRLPEHCITWSKMYAWRENSPFRAADGEPVAIDADDANHMRWLFEAAKERASQFNIPGVTYKLTQGVIKNIIPAIASTNATIAGPTHLSLPPSPSLRLSLISLFFLPSRPSTVDHSV